MPRAKSLPCPRARFSELITSTQRWLLGEGFKCQKLQTEESGPLYQIEKAGGIARRIHRHATQARSN
jgi:hypothetical protein